jgi:hypothetical protein
MFEVAESATSELVVDWFTSRKVSDGSTLKSDCGISKSKGGLPEKWSFACRIYWSVRRWKLIRA